MENHKLSLYSLDETIKMYVNESSGTTILNHCHAHLSLPHLHSSYCFKEDPDFVKIFQKMDMET